MVIVAMVLMGWKIEGKVGDYMTRIIPTLPNMKPITAFCFLAYGIASWMLTYPLARHRQGMVVAIGLIVFGFNALAALSIFFDLNTGISRTWILDERKLIYADQPGVPSVLTIIGFWTYTMYIFAAIAFTNTKAKFFCSVALMTMSVCAIAGHMLHFPPLFMYIPHFSNGMAVNTAICFFLLGLHGYVINTKYIFLSLSDAPPLGMEFVSDRLIEQAKKEGFYDISLQ